MVRSVEHPMKTEYTSNDSLLDKLINHYSMQGTLESKQSLDLTQYEASSEDQTHFSIVINL